MKETIKTFLPFALGVVIIILLFKDCGNEPTVIVKEPDTKLTQINLDLVKLLKGQVKLLEDNIRITDSIGQIHKTKYLALKETNRNALLHHICDTIEVVKYYDAVVSACDTVIKADSLAINERDTTIKVLNKMVSKQSEIISEVQEHDNWQKNVNDVLKKEVKKQKRTKIAVIVVAIVGVVGTVFLLK